MQPWLPLTDDVADLNVAHERDAPGSLFNLYRRLIALRRGSPALHGGSYRAVAATGDVLAYMREADSERLLVALNLGAAPAVFTMPEMTGPVVLSSAADRAGEPIVGLLRLQPNEGVIVALG